VLGIVASGLGLTTWSLNWFSRPHDYHVMVGYYCWQASQLVLAVGALWAAQAALREPKPAAPAGAAANRHMVSKVKRAHPGRGLNRSVFLVLSVA
jgi:hypothetical protein